MKLLTAHDRARLLANGQLRRQAERQDPEAIIDFLPVVKLFTPGGACTWLLTELDSDDTDRAFGLCDLGLGYPELGYVSLAELSALRDSHGLLVERDIHFVPAKSLAAYTDEARALGGIRT